MLEPEKRAPTKIQLAIAEERQDSATLTNSGRCEMTKSGSECSRAMEGVHGSSYGK